MKFVAPFGAEPPRLVSAGSPIALQHPIASREDRAQTYHNGLTTIGIDWSGQQTTRHRTRGASATVELLPLYRNYTG
jgi:hypothetical protein